MSKNKEPKKYTIQEQKEYLRKMILDDFLNRPWRLNKNLSNLRGNNNPGLKINNIKPENITKINNQINKDIDLALTYSKNKNTTLKNTEQKSTKKPTLVERIKQKIKSNKNSKKLTHTHPEELKRYLYHIKNKDNLLTELKRPESVNNNFKDINDNFKEWNEQLKLAPKQQKIDTHTLPKHQVAKPKQKSFKERLSDMTNRLTTSIKEKIKKKKNKPPTLKKENKDRSLPSSLTSLSDMSREVSQQRLQRRAIKNKIYNDFAGSHLLKYSPNSLNNLSKDLKKLRINLGNDPQYLTLSDTESLKINNQINKEVASAWKDYVDYTKEEQKLSDKEQELMNEKKKLGNKQLNIYLNFSKDPNLLQMKTESLNKEIITLSRNLNKLEEDKKNLEKSKPEYYDLIKESKNKTQNYEYLQLWENKVNTVKNKNKFEKFWNKMTEKGSSLSSKIKSYMPRRKKQDKNKNYPNEGKIR